ncbi:MAG TPA: glycogen debranching N-terminal domain-containing protein [Micromonosporaceae bacterium]
MGKHLVPILDGNTFVVSDRRGDVEPAPRTPTGFFSFDTRFLSVWRLSLNGERLNALAADSPEYFEARFFLVPGAPTHYVDAKTTLMRKRTIGQGGFHEVLTVINHDDRPVDYQVRLDAGADFRDLVEIKDRSPKVGTYRSVVRDGTLILDYQRDRYHRQALISVDRPAQIDERGLAFSFRLAPNTRWTGTVRVRAVVVGARGGDLRETLEARRPRDKQTLKQDLAEWLDRAPELRSDWRPLLRMYRRSLIDLAALRYSTLAFPDHPIPAAGLPWFMGIFGREAMLSSLQALPFVPELAAATLRLLAINQGSRVDDFRDEEPGKILLEFRYGETAAFEERPNSPYFGAADSTLLFLILLDEYERWSGDVDLVRELEPEARAAITWMSDYADLMGDGYVWYQSRNPRHGLPNQCWKTSPDAISYRDGRLPGLPRATCELQGYAYDAKLRSARLARLVWNDAAFADRLEREAAELKDRFNRDFWIEEGGYYALALDGDHGKVDALSSNIGHLLWSGIVEESRARAVADHLLGPQLFSGWGVRTLSDRERRYNPVGYHVGTVWPSDNAFIVWGLRRYGFNREAARVATTIVEAAQYFDGRLPEAFGGYDRAQTKYPVPYPTACTPHVCSTGASLLMLRALLGLEPYNDVLVVDPAVPVEMGRIELVGIPGRWGRRDAFARGREPVD